MVPFDAGGFGKSTNHRPKWYVYTANYTENPVEAPRLGFGAVPIRVLWAFDMVVQTAGQVDGNNEEIAKPSRTTGCSAPGSA